MLNHLLKSFLLGALVLGASLTSAAEGRDQEALNREALARAPALMKQAEAACRGVKDLPISTYAIDDQVRTFDEKLRKEINSPADVSRIPALIQELERELGPLDRIPSLSLHMNLAMLAGMQGNEEEVIRQRAMNFALLRWMFSQGDGKSARTALPACTVSNEYFVLRIALQARELKGQSLREEAGRVYDVMKFIDRDGHPQERYFEITDAYHSMSKMFAPDKK